MDSSKLIEQLIDHESERLKPYLDCCGKYWRDCKCGVKGNLTLGIGRNLDSMGITVDESRYLVRNDIKRVSSELDKAIPWWSGLAEARQRVLADMCFNMGITKLLGFHDTLNYTKAGDYVSAARSMLSSLWAKQTGRRADDDAGLMERGL